MKVFQTVEFYVISIFLFMGMQAQAVSLPDFTRLAEQNMPAVVNISTVRHQSRNSDGVSKIPGVPDGHPFGDLFRRFLERQGMPEDFGFDAQSLGSGFIVSDDGYVLTNAHVVENADEIIVRLYDRRELGAELVGIDEQTDLALLKIEADNLRMVTSGSSKDLEVGEWVMAIGSPFGFDHTVTAGIVSAKDRGFRDQNYVPFIQTDVAINPGNSGGPLINTRGEVVGINARISSEPGRRSYAGLSFAIPMEVARDVIQQLKKHGHVSRGWLGVLIQDITPELSSTFGLEKPMGALVSRVFADSPAEAAGIKVGDVILEFQGEPIKTSSELPPMVGGIRAGQKVKLEILRQSKRRMIDLVIGALPDKTDKTSAVAPGRPGASAHSGRLGLTLKSLDKAALEDIGVDYGVYILAVDDGPAREIGLRSGDVIQMLDSQKITSPGQFDKLVRQLPAGRNVAILVHRESGPVFLALRVPR